MRDWLIFGVLAGLSIAFAGCGDKSTLSLPASSKLNDKETDADQEARRSERLAATGIGTASGSFQPGAAGAVEIALEGFRTGHLELVFDFLPNSYQRDLNGLLHAFGEQVDPELWARIIRLLDRGNQVLRTKKDLLLPLFPPAPDPVQLSEAWDDFTRAADSMIHGRLGDIDELRSADVRDLLRNDLGRTIRRLMILSVVANPGSPNPLNDLSLVQVDLVEASDVAARVRITPPNQTNVEPTDFVSVEGKWVPRSVAEGWEATLNHARQGIGLWAREANSEEKQRVLEIVTVCERVLDQMLAAETTNQLASAATPLFLQATQLSQRMVPLESTLPAGPAEGVSLLIQRELTEDELTQLLNMLEPLTDDPEREFHLATANGGKTFVSIKPVHDITAFAARLTFGKDPVIDESARTITLRDVEWK